MALQTCERCEHTSSSPSAYGDKLLLVSWNVAGFRRTHDLIKTHYGSLDSFLARHEADIFCIQETRIGRASMSSLAECKILGAITEAYESFWSFNETPTPRGMSGTNGVAVWIKKNLAKGASATQRVFEVEDLDQEGRCLMVELVSGLVIFNVYAPFLKNEATEKTENLKTPESTESIEENEHRRREFAKLKFLQLLQQRVEKTQREGKMAIICGDLNLTWRTADVHENGLYVKVIENCIAGNPAWSLSAKGTFLADLSKSLMRPPCPRACNPSRPLYKLTQRTQDGNEIHWIRVGDAVKELDFELVLPWTEAMDLLKIVDVMKAEADAMDGTRSLGHAWCSLWSLRSLQLRSKETDTELWPSDDTNTNDIKPHTPNEALEGLAPAARSNSIVLRFGVSHNELNKLVIHGHTPHFVKENSCVEHMRKWLSSSSLLDTFSSCHELALERFTCWMQLANLRYCNKGTRLDYILCDKRLQPFLVPGTLAGASKEHGVSEAYSAEAAWNATTHFGRWHGAHQVQKGDGGGLSLQQDDMKLNDSQFRAPHTGILYTPPKYSDHVPVCAHFKGLELPGPLPVSPLEKATQPWRSQATLSTFFVSKKQKVSYG